MVHWGALVIDRGGGSDEDEISHAPAVGRMRRLPVRED